MQDFYKMTQDPKEKVSNFGIRLKVALDRIMVFHPESLTQLEATKKLKGLFYYGVRQNVREGLRYYYKVLQADYTTLLTKARSIEAVKSTSTSATLVTLKSAAPEDTKPMIQSEDLSKQMSELITIVKKQVQMSKDQQKSKGSSYNGQDKRSKGNGNGERNLKGADINSSGSFRNGTPPIQCYCGGWGHKAFECPVSFKLQNKGGSPEQEGKKSSPEQNIQCMAGQSQLRQSKTKLRTIQDNYHNPDPIAR